PDGIESIAFTWVDTFPPPADIEPGQLFALSLSGTTTAFTHGLHRFAAKFVPQVPAWALDHFGSRASVVLDPFMGSGTTLVEGILRGGTTIGVDIDPLARLIARAKVTPVADDQSQTTYVSGTLLKHPPDVAAVFWRFLRRAVDGLADLNRKRHGEAAVVIPDGADATALGLEPGGVDLAVTSPPYLDSVDYP